MRYKIRFDIGFVGGRFSGWQSQGPVPSVEAQTRKQSSAPTGQQNKEIHRICEDINNICDIGICVGWNRRKGCSKKKCQYRHVCAQCGSDQHGCVECDGAIGTIESGQIPSEKQGQKLGGAAAAKDLVINNPSSSSLLQSSVPDNVVQSSVPDKFVQSSVPDQESTTLPSVQDTVERWLSRAVKDVLQPVRSGGVVAPSRTDKGVNARSFICFMNVHLKGSTSMMNLDTMNTLYDTLVRTAPMDLSLNGVPKMEDAKTAVKKKDGTRKTYKYFVVTRNYPCGRTPCSSEMAPCCEGSPYSSRGNHTENCSPDQKKACIVCEDTVSSKTCDDRESNSPERTDHVPDLACTWIWDSLSLFGGDAALVQHNVGLDLDAARDVIEKELLGTKDFGQFATGCDGKDTMRTLFAASVVEQNYNHVTTTYNRGSVYEFTFTADGFLRHMVRRLVGYLVETCLIVNLVEKCMTVDVHYVRRGMDADDLTEDDLVDRPEHDVDRGAVLSSLFSRHESKQEELFSRHDSEQEELFSRHESKQYDNKSINISSRSKPRRAPPHGLWLWETTTCSDSLVDESTCTSPGLE